MTTPDAAPGPLDDASAMQRALALAQRAVGLSDPNPRVGCVITGAGGQVLGEGWTQEAGGPHAEVSALRDAQARGRPVRGATAHVTLEPCSHHGRTPPCCEALVAAGVARVSIATLDPNPLVDGQGVARLRAAGVAVSVGQEQAAAQALNIGFFHRMRHGRPWVRMKIAASLDGRTALPNGVSQWITGEAARRDGHTWRRRAGAVLTGVGTVVEDDPRLDVRLVDTAHQPQRIVVDAGLDIPRGARILQAPGRVLVVAGDRPAVREAGSDVEREASLRALGAEVIRLPRADGKVDLPALLVELGRRHINELHVEAGHKLNGSFLREGLVDELLLYLAPMLLGDGAGLAALGVREHLSDVPRWTIASTDMLGDDLRLMLRRRGTAQDDAAS